MADHVSDEALGDAVPLGEADLTVSESGLSAIRGDEPLDAAALVAAGGLGIEAAFVGLCAVLFATAIYLFLSRSIIRLLLGVVILGNAVNLTIFTSGRLTREVPPIVPIELDVPDIATANPLPQALVLTAIVISFSFFAFLLVLAYRAYQSLGTDDTDRMRAAEPIGEPSPPTGY